jgi:hypothetical protein
LPQQWHERAILLCGEGLRARAELASTGQSAADTSLAAPTASGSDDANALAVLNARKAAMPATSQTDRDAMKSSPARRSRDHRDSSRLQADHAEAGRTRQAQNC